MHCWLYDWWFLCVNIRILSIIQQSNLSWPSLHAIGNKLFLSFSVGMKWCYCLSKQKTTVLWQNTSREIRILQNYFQISHCTTKLIYKASNLNQLIRFVPLLVQNYHSYYWTRACPNYYSAQSPFFYIGCEHNNVQ